MGGEIIDTDAAGRAEVLLAAACGHLPTFEAMRHARHLLERGLITAACAPTCKGMEVVVKLLGAWAQAEGGQP